jgi:polysaccharide export outer membrane protein
MEGMRMTHRRIGWFLALAAVVTTTGAGCQTVKTPEQQIAKTNLPREFQKVSMPDYVIEPPDLLVIEVLQTLQGRPITGETLVRPDGMVSLGFYGQVYVAGLTLREAKEKIILHLRKYLTDEYLGLVQEDEETGEPKEIDPADSDRVVVDVSAYNSKFYYVQGDVGTPGRLPITGNETVLDAIIFAGGLVPTAAPRNIRLVRPAPPGACCEQVLPVNYHAITSTGDPTTNYQLMPGDRVVVYRDPIVRGTLFLDRLAAPFSTVINNIFTYSFAARGIQALNAPVTGTAAVTPALPTITPGAR